MTSKWEIASAVMASNMPPPMRLIMLVQLDAADTDGVIPEQFTPSLTDLVNKTGLGRGTVADRLNHLEDGGWMKRDRPTVAEARAGAKTRYAMAIGDPNAGLKPKEQSPASSGSSSPRAGLVREEDQSESRTSPGAGPDLVREPDQASPGAGRGVVREPDGKDTPHSPRTQPPPASSPSAADAEAATLPGFEKPKKTKATPKRERDEIWDALMDACGVDTSQITEASRKAYNRAVKELKAVGATKSQIALRAHKFQQQWTGVRLTPTALVRRWAELDTGQAASRSSADEERCPKHKRQPKDHCTICDSEARGAA